MEEKIQIEQFAVNHKNQVSALLPQVQCSSGKRNCVGGK